MKPSTSNHHSSDTISKLNIHCGALMKTGLARNAQKSRFCTTFHVTVADVTSMKQADL
jgi:hypothetical protein